MNMRNLLTAIVLLFTFSSFSGAPSSSSSKRLIIYNGCFESDVTVIISYNPGLQQIVDVAVYGPTQSYAVTSYSPSSTVYNVGSTLYTTYFTVYFTVPGIGTRTASWGGELSSDCY